MLNSSVKRHPGTIKPTYPCLMRDSRSYDIYLFVNKTTAVVVFSLSTDDVGVWMTEAKIEDFVYFEGEVTLSNDTEVNDG